MAQAIPIFFKSAKLDEVRQFLDEVAVRANEASVWSGYGSETWLYPRNNEARVLVYRYDHLLAEYEGNEIEDLIDYLGGLPTTIITLEYMGSQGERAPEAVANLAISLLTRFPGVVTDLVNRYWLSGEVIGNVRKGNNTFRESISYAILESRDE